MKATLGRFGHSVIALEPHQFCTRPTEGPQALDTPLVVDSPNDPEFLKQFARSAMLHNHLDKDSEIQFELTQLQKKENT